MAKEETRQSAKETLRLFLLDSLFQQERYFTKAELTEKLEVSIPTLDRDIRRLRDDFNAPLEYNSEKGGYHYSSKLFKLPSVFVPEQEMPAYSMVLKLFEQFQNTPLYTPLLNICESFESPIKTDAIGSGQVDFRSTHLEEKPWFETRIVMGKRSVASVDETNWDIILKALQNNQVLEFDYENVRTSKKGYSRKIEPWQLIYDSEQWYLRGYAEDQNNPNVKNIRNFVVPRMKNLKLLPQHFKLPDEKIWCLDEYNVGSFGALASDKIEEYKFIFQGTALYFAEADFAPNKKVEPYKGAHAHKDGAMLVSFTSNQPLGIIRAFFPYGEDIIPLAPQSFVDEWTDNVRKMAKSLGI
jgi:predicted DNA-binding transcriptional regulator YafY